MIDKAMDIWREHAILREGKRNSPYKDSLGKWTVGIGHLILPSDNIALDSCLSDDYVYKLFEQDSQKALKISLVQQKELARKNPAVNTPEFLAALISVNFQLGDWSSVFYSSYPLLLDGHYGDVIARLKSSKWYSQTPVRVNDFIEAIERAYA